MLNGKLISHFLLVCFWHCLRCLVSTDTFFPCSLFLHFSSSFFQSFYAYVASSAMLEKQELDVHRVKLDCTVILQWLQLFVSNVQLVGHLIKEAPNVNHVKQANTTMSLVNYA